MKKNSLFLLTFLCLTSLMAQGPFDSDIQEVEEKVIQWRRHLHQNPELSNREFETAKYIEQHLTALGVEVQTEVAHTGVVGVLRTGRPGPTIALRADMDALPVVERVDLPFASKVKTTYLGKDVGVMHACGHDTHVAMLMGAAEVLVKNKNQLKGNVVFIFQPAEEGAPIGEEGGAALMVKEGVLKNPDVEVVFGIHINSMTEVGKVRYKPGGTMAAADQFNIKVNGKQTHGSTPWTGIDPITIAAQIIQGLNNIVSRQMPLTNEAAVITVGKIDGGVRNNIVPESVEMIGTIRTLDTEMQKSIHQRIKTTAENIAEAWGATADVQIITGYPVTYNNPELTAEMLPTVKATAGADNVILAKAVTGAEDFSFYAQEVPGLFLFLGGMPKGLDPSQAGPHHTPDFFIDESGLKLGVGLFCNLVVDYMDKH
ncbi:MAG: amidohydrolase [Saprospiraceae bacterium]